MLKFYNYDIVFQEIPDEVTMAVNITNCPNRCPECHSKFLWDDVGTELNEENLSIIINSYEQAITCLCFMGGDNDPAAVNGLAAFIRRRYPTLKTGWYSGRQELSPVVSLSNFDFVKLGPYLADKGSLKQKTTNQRFYRVLADGCLEDCTARFWHK